MIKLIIIGELLITIVAALSDAVIIAMIGGIVSIASLLITVLIKQKVEKVSTQIDGHMTKLLDLTEKGSRAEGKLEGKEEAEIQSLSQIQSQQLCWQNFTNPLWEMLKD